LEQEAEQKAIAPGGWIYGAVASECSIVGTSIDCPYGALSLAPNPGPGALPGIAQLSTTLSGLLQEFVGLLGNALGAAVVAVTNPQVAGGKDEVCWEQYQADLDTCRRLHSAGCYDQAAQRYANCLTGKPLPPFPYYAPPAPPGRPVRRNADRGEL
jgi:hypothetical protein